jgi:hypothetical protein
LANSTPEKSSPRSGAVNPGLSPPEPFNSVDSEVGIAGNPEAADNTLNEGLPPYSV